MEDTKVKNTKTKLMPLEQRLKLKQEASLACILPDPDHHPTESTTIEPSTIGKDTGSKDETLE